MQAFTNLVSGHGKEGKKHKDSRKGEKEEEGLQTGADFQAIDKSPLQLEDDKLAKLAAAFKQKAGELGLSGGLTVSVVLGIGDVLEFEVGWGLEADHLVKPADDTDPQTADEQTAYKCVNSYCSLANDIKRRSLKWKIPMSVTVGLQVGLVKVEATLNIAPSDETCERDKEAILAADWGDVDIHPGNDSIRLKSELVHHDGEAFNKAMSKTLIGKKFDSLREKLILTSKKMNESGLHGSIKASMTLSYPAFLTLGIKTFEVSIGVEIPLTEILAAQKVWAEDQQVRNTGELTVKVLEGVNLPVMDYKTSDPFVVCAIEGGNSGDSRQTKAISSELNPKWNQVLLPMPCAEKDETLIVSLYDEDNLHKNDFIDEWIIPLDKIKLVPGQPKTLICPLKYRRSFRKDPTKEHYITIQVTWSPKAH